MVCCLVEVQHFASEELNLISREVMAEVALGPSKRKTDDNIHFSWGFSWGFWLQPSYGGPKLLKEMAGTTRLELATSAVTVSGIQVLSTT